MFRRLALILTLAVSAATGSASSASALVPIPFAPVAANPAERLLALPIEAALYEPAARCLPNARRPGTERFAAWLDANARGAYWGSYRCEKWGPRSASLHAEKRAVDWHLDARRRSDRRAAARLIALLTAPDSAGNPHALARRMGVEEIIWDCGYWGAGMLAFRPYSPCLTRDGRMSRKVGATVAHRDHIHFGLTRAGSLGRTSFWLRGSAPARPSSVPRASAPPSAPRPAPRPEVPVPDVAPAGGGGAQAPATVG